MARFRISNGVMGFSLPNGVSYSADENGVFELELSAALIQGLADHGCALIAVEDEPVPEAVVLEEAPAEEEEPKKRRGRPRLNPEGK